MDILQLMKQSYKLFFIYGIFDISKLNQDLIWDSNDSPNFIFFLQDIHPSM